MLDPQKTLEREALLKRIRELDAEIAQYERNLREVKHGCRLRSSYGFTLGRFIEASIPELAGKIRMR